MLRNIDDASIFHRKVPKRAAHRSPPLRRHPLPSPLPLSSRQIHSLRTCQRGKLEAMCLPSSKRPILSLSDAGHFDTVSASRDLLLALGKRE